MTLLVFQCTHTLYTETKWLSSFPFILIHAAECYADHWVWDVSTTP